MAKVRRKRVTKLQRHFADLCNALLSDPNGISDPQYLRLLAVAYVISKDFAKELVMHVDATDSRFYLPEGTTVEM